MLKKINRVLKLVGLNLVRAKRKSPKWQKLPPYTPEELENAPLKCAVNQPGTVPLADYMGDAEWHSAPAPVGCEDHKITLTENPGKTHYVGDGCVPPHPEFDRQSTPCSGVSTPCGDRPRVEQPNSDNKITGPTS